MISLVTDTIDMSDISELISWLKTNPRLTKGKKTKDFENEWSKYIGCKYSLFVNSGSSANLLISYAYKKLSDLDKPKVVVPAVAWSTTISPFIQFGFDVVLCDIDLENLNIDLIKLEEIFKKENPDVLMLVNILGFTTDMDSLIELCNKYNVKILEDSCETLGTSYKGIKTGNFGMMSSFSMYFGHHISTIEGGMICTNDKNIYDLLLMLRSHGWDRDLDNNKKEELKNKFGISDFKSMYSFYVESFNLRSTDLQAVIGLGQLKKLDDICNVRKNNFDIYQSNLKNNYWKINPRYNDFVSNFAYPIIHPKKDNIIKCLNENGIDYRPLVCGSLGNQPFSKNIKKYNLTNSDIVDEYGLYVPNHHGISKKDVIKICDIINGAIK